MKVYYIKDGQLKLANFTMSNGKISDYVYTFNSMSLFFNQKDDNTFETSSYDNMESFGFYVHSWKFDLESGKFTSIGSRFMDKDKYFNYDKNQY